VESTQLTTATKEKILKSAVVGVGGVHGVFRFGIEGLLSRLWKRVTPFWEITRFSSKIRKSPPDFIGKIRLVSQF
jgi:hypothetical protein